MNIQILDEAQQDISDGFYEAQKDGLGGYFLDSLFSGIDSLQLYAGIHGRHFEFHPLLSKRFPFAIYYRIRGNIVRVHAVLVRRQDPARIEERLE